MPNRSLAVYQGQTAVQGTVVPANRDRTVVTSQATQKVDTSSCPLLIGQTADVPRSSRLTTYPGWTPRVHDASPADPERNILLRYRNIAPTSIQVKRKDGRQNLARKNGAFASARRVNRYSIR
jgi:hypothetical protein